MNKKNQKTDAKITNEKPISLFPLDFKEALAALLAVENDPCWKEQQEFNDAIKQLAETPLTRTVDTKRIIEELNKVKADPDYESELLSDPLVKADKRLT